MNRTEQLAVIVPYRNRETHKAQFLPEISSFLINKGLRFKIIIVEQLDQKPFNRATLLNIGCKIAAEKGCSYFALHDVDTIPVSPEIDYSFPTQPRHLFGPSHSTGGVLLISKEHYYKCNGMSNRYYGYGREDLDFKDRLDLSGIFLDQTQLTPRVEADPDIVKLHNGWKLLPHKNTFVENNFTEDEKKRYAEGDWVIFKDKYINSPNWKEYEKFQQNRDIFKTEGLSSLVCQVKKQEELAENLLLLGVEL